MPSKKKFVICVEIWSKYEIFSWLFTSNKFHSLFIQPTWLKTISFQLQKLLKTSANPKSAKKKKKAAEKAVAAPEGEAPALVEHWKN